MDKALNFVDEGLIVTNDDLVVLDYNDTLRDNFISKVKRGIKIIEIISFPDINEAFESASSGRLFSKKTPVYFGLKRVECEVTVLKENRLYWIFKDVTAQETLKNAKADFVSAVSHEFMTPIGVVKGFLEIIKDPSTPLRLKENYIDRTISQLNRLEKLLDQLLSLSELEMKRYKPNFSSVNVFQLLSEAKEEMAYRWKPKKIRIFIDSDESLFVYTDGSALYRIVTNLLSNAIKYSYENGEVEILAKKQRGLLMLSIEDHGIGIKEKEVPRIFERFYRASNCTQTGAKGMGLGLALVKHLCEILNAKISIESKYTLGTKVTIVVPDLHTGQSAKSHY